MRSQAASDRHDGLLVRGAGPHPQRRATASSADGSCVDQICEDLARHRTRLLRLRAEMLIATATESEQDRLDALQTVEGSARRVKDNEAHEREEEDRVLGLLTQIVQLRKTLGEKEELCERRSQEFRVHQDATGAEDTDAALEEARVCPLERHEGTILQPYADAYAQLQGAKDEMETVLKDIREAEGALARHRSEASTLEEKKTSAQELLVRAEEAISQAEAQLSEVTSAISNIDRDLRRLKAAARWASRLESSFFDVTLDNLPLLVLCRHQQIAIAVTSRNEKDLLDIRDLDCDAEELSVFPGIEARLREAGFSALELRHMGFGAEELKKGGFDAASLRSAGFGVAELQDLGVDGEQLREAGSTPTDVQPPARAPRPRGVGEDARKPEDPALNDARQALVAGLDT